MSVLPDRHGDTLTAYRRLLEEIDGWFARCLERYPEQIACRKGCCGCCRGLFDITLLDAALLQHGVARLPAPQRQQVLDRCRKRIPELRQRWPEFSPPFILNHLPDDEWQQMPEDDTTPCPLLSDAGICMVYPWRPMICRLHGLPNIDLSGEDFTSEICSLNFTGVDPYTLEGVQWKFREVFETEIGLFERFSRELTGRTMRELDTFVPCAPLIDFTHSDWQALLHRYEPG